MVWDPSLPPWRIVLPNCWREGGVDNLGEVLRAIELLLQKQQPNPIELRLQPMPDPAPWDWQEDAGPRIGVVLYRAQLQAGDVALAEALCLTCRDVGLCPRLLWVSSLRDPGVQAGVIDLLRTQEVELVVAGTSFASVKTAEAGLGSPLWEQLNVPVLQLLSSSRSRESWRNSSRGLDPLDLSLQVVMPELDGRLTTRPCAFREHQMSVPDLGAAVPSQVPDLEGIQWLIEHSQRWITLRKTDNSDRRIAMVLANYPVRDGRIANGVGLDTPASCAAMLQWLKHSSHNLGPATFALQRRFADADLDAGKNQFSRGSPQASPGLLAFGTSTNSGGATCRLRQGPRLQSVGVSPVMPAILIPNVALRSMGFATAMWWC